MSTQPVTRLVSAEQYLEFDRNSEVRNEYIRGQIVPMVDATAAHGLILTNTGVAFSKRLSGSPCRAYTGSPRVGLDQQRVYAYPDLTVICGEPQYTDEEEDIISNPKVVVEIMSPSTRTYDLGINRRMYSRLPSLDEMLLIEQERTWVEHWRRVPNGHWDVDETDDGTIVIRLESLNCEIPIAEFYSGIESTRREPA